MNKFALLLPPIFMLLQANLLEAQTFRNASKLLRPAENISTLGGASAVDFNNDGLVDIYHRGRLYLNKGQNGFEDILLSTGMIPGEAVFGAAFGDYDNDGYLDIFFEDLTESGKLYRNRRNGTFIQSNQATNLTAHPAAQGAAWGDFNLDGKLDLFVNNDFGQNQLFKNLDNATFEDISLAAGVEAPGNSYGMAWGDFDNNGYPDVFIATCSLEPQNSIKHLLRNNGDGTFTDVNVAAGVNDSLSSWGIIWLDYDNDSDLDIFITNTEHPGRPGHDRLYRNEGNGTFTNTTELAGVAGGANEDSYGVAAADFDNDGWIDIYVPNSGSFHKLYRNNGNGTFTDIAASAGIIERNHEIIAVADYDNDGWVDIFTAGSPQNKLLFNNGGANHWIAVKARGRAANYYGAGARIEVVTGTVRQMREITAGDGFCSQNLNFTAHFGLGAHTRVDSLIIKWPGGAADKITNVNVDRYLTVVEGIGINNPPSTFGLVEPADGHILNDPATAVRFAWQPAEDAESDPISYRLYLLGPEIDTVFANINGTAFLIDAGFFQRHRVCRWTVDASDGYSIAAGINIFSFNDAPCQSAQFFKLAAGNNIVPDRGLSFGSSWGDYDNDGDPDLFVANRFGNNSLFSNNGDGSFTAVNTGDVVNDGAPSYGGSWGDFDNDGDLDLFVTNLNENNFLYANSAGVLTRITAGAIVSDGGASTGCSWGDYNNDGYLDLFVANSRSQNNFLYSNNRNGTFTKITAGVIVSDGGSANGVAWADDDGDGDLDLFVASSENDLLYSNNGNGTFTKITAGDIVTDGLVSRSASWGDYDNDGDLDLFVANDSGQNNRLYANNGDGTFTTITTGEIVNDGGNSYSSSWGDYDNDGDLDLFVGNLGSSFIYANDGDGSFTKVVTDVVILNGSWSSCTADYDGDGDVDLFVTNSSNRDILYANLGNANNWSNIKCVGTISNRTAIGAKVRVKATISGKPVWQMREISGQTGYLSQNSLNAAFGMGDAETIDSLKIEWPSGLVEAFINVPANRFITATEGQGITGVKDASNRLPMKLALHQNYPNPFNPTTTIRFAIERPGVIRLEIYDLAGRLVRTLINNENKIPGEHLAIWDGRDDYGKPVGSGVYFYRLFSNGSDKTEKTKKMVLLR